MATVLFPRGVPIEKRLFDLIISGITLFILSPLFLVISILVVILDGWPILFIQDRPGLLGHIYQNYKFRTMRILKKGKGELVPEEERIFPFGRLLRRFSLDELPELLNVIKGEMSIVGPRPLLVEYLPRYSKEQQRRHEVLPGITGWAQIHGRNVLSWEERFRLDVWYVDHWSFWLDIKIIFLTVWKVLKGEGITPVKNEIMEKFMGSQKPKS
jgi:sugar transferase EpsL